MTDEDIKAGLALCEAALEGPWKVDARSVKTAWVEPENPKKGHYVVADNVVEPDASFIAQARTLLPEALRALQGARQECDALRRRLRMVEPAARRVAAGACHGCRMTEAEPACSCGLDALRDALEGA